MKFARLGNSGLEVSRICLGCMSYGDPSWRPWTLDQVAAREHFAVALEAGINFFDTADMYSKGVSEEVTGRILGELANRDEVVIATKVYFAVADGSNRRGLSRKHVLAACEASLRRLGTDHIDLYQIHRWDRHTPIEETLEALDSLVRSGKVRYLGASSIAAWQMAKALHVADARQLHRFVSMQDHYNLVYREEEREMVPLCLDEGVGIIPWSPLARGFLSGARNRDDPRPTHRAQNDDLADRMYYRSEDFDVLDALVQVAERRGRSPAQIALSWLLSVPGVVAPIIGTTRVSQLRDCCDSVDIELTSGEIVALEEPYVPHPIHGFQPPTPRNWGDSID